MAFLSVSTTTAEARQSNTNLWTDHPVLSVREPQVTLVPNRKPTSAEAWERFETEYSPPQKSPSPIKHQIETAKYGLDTAVFAFDRFFKNVENQADFSLDQGSLRRTREIPFTETLKNPRVKLDLEMGQSARPYAGVRIIIPFGR
jgi:hypothetical protein